MGQHRRQNRELVQRRIRRRHGTLDLLAIAAKHAFVTSVDDQQRRIPSDGHPCNVGRGDMRHVGVIHCFESLQRSLPEAKQIAGRLSDVFRKPRRRGGCRLELRRQVLLRYRLHDRRSQIQVEMILTVPRIAVGDAEIRQHGTHVHIGVLIKPTRQ